MVARKQIMSGLVALVGTGAASALFILPAKAQVNPRPSIFNEAPFNGQSSPSTPGMEAGVGGMSPMESPVTPGSDPMVPEMPPEMLPGTMPAPTSDATPSAGTIIDVAASNGSFEILTAALQAAGLTDVLQGQGPYTVFAPTDEAFEALPDGVVEQLLQPANRDLLVRILSYHVVPGEVMSSDLTSGDVSTVEGAPITVETGEAGVMVNDASVIQPDIPASNGVIHVIDRVILPPDA